jgi:hypothetical protein
LCRFADYGRFLLKVLLKITHVEKQNALYARFCFPQSIPGLKGLCSVERCASDFVTAGGTIGDWTLCPDHYLLASRDSRRKHIRALFWQAAIQNCFANDAIYERIVASGHYLKLCTMTEDAARRADDTWRVVVREATAALGKRTPKRPLRH